MMTNLFSTFDPSTSNLLALNWLSLILPTLLVPLNFWVKKTRMEMLISTIMKTLHNEFKNLLNWTFTMGVTSFIIMVFWFITINNLMGLMPYIFTATSHMVITLTLALPIWLSLMIFGWLNNTSKMFAHLLPMGTPPALMMFMILIESISNIIRPITLSIRLSANMIAGHLLLTLLGNQGTIYNMKNNILIINTQLLLMTLELAVAMIQGYVFIILISLYTTEIH
uniref:ATP synthase subunit a n=1 Tax=Oligolophus tienmushanensis TaxID=1508515 RepID=A0A140X727_9ARAC|nr:ATP synthase F0 subunit 6 [Oligolophus tienmushanensis]AIG60112.1 ATP synthase F0 subunit 6 [Oligolophus tienmushanensis]